LGRGSDFEGSTYSASLEFLHNGGYAELRTENFVEHSRVQFWTMRGGYLLHPKPAVAGGATLGYRRVAQGSSESALEVGFPIVIGSLRNWMRLEPTYIISSRGVSWTYRFQGEWPIGQFLVGGFDFDVKPIRQDAPYFSTFTLLFGWRP